MTITLISIGVKTNTAPIFLTEIEQIVIFSDIKSEYELPEIYDKEFDRVSITLESKTGLNFTILS